MQQTFFGLLKQGWTPLLFPLQSTSGAFPFAHFLILFLPLWMRMSYHFSFVGIIFATFVCSEFIANYVFIQLYVIILALLYRSFNLIFELENSLKYKVIIIIFFTYLLEILALKYNSSFSSCLHCLGSNIPTGGILSLLYNSFEQPT